jgi:sensor domain CHASE-containing protein
MKPCWRTARCISKKRLNNMDASTAIQLAVPLVLIGVWLIRLEGRVNTQEALHRDLKVDVMYIRERIDRALNGNHDA